MKAETRNRVFEILAFDLHVTQDLTGPSRGAFWKDIQDLIDAPASEWNSLTANIENKSYCITVESASGTFYNWTVGDVCRIIITRTLSEAYFRSLDPMTLEVYGKFRSPEFARGPGKLKEWLHAGREKTIAQLQAEACDWAIDELSNRDDRNRDHWVKAIRDTAIKLRGGGEPVHYDGFGAEEFRPCKREVPDRDPFAEDPRPRQS